AVAPAPVPVAPADTQLQQTAQMQGVVGANNVAVARQKVEQANAARARNDYATAATLYGDAAQLDPSNAAAQQGRNDMLALTDRSGAPMSPLDIEAKRAEAQRQEIRWK